MVHPNEAQEMCVAFITKYLDDCRCENTVDAGDAVMKLVSVAGLTLIQLVGQVEAVQRVQGVSLHMSKPEFME